MFSECHKIQITVHHSNANAISCGEFKSFVILKSTERRFVDSLITNLHFEYLFVAKNLLKNYELNNVNKP